MSYGFLVKVSEEVSSELLKQCNIPTAPIIFQGSDDQDEVTKQFFAALVDIARKIEKLFKINIPIKMTNEDRRQYDSCTMCNLCKSALTVKNRKVADHFH